MFALGVLVGALASARPTAASPTRWGMARSETAFQEEAARLAAEQELLKQKLAQKKPLYEDPILRPASRVPKAIAILESAGAARSKSWYLRLVLGRCQHEVQRWSEAAALFESVARDPETPDVFRADALAELAIDYARLNRQEDEIEAYEVAVALEPHSSSRATMLANQAEAFMVTGDIARAIAGYRASLDSLLGWEAVVLAPTTLWSLGVALDRSGDLEGGLESVARARSYDPKDVRIGGASWFFVPDYDEAYFSALGHWQKAREQAGTTGQRGSPSGPDVRDPFGQPSLIEGRLAAYERAILAWKEFLARAPDRDHYVPVARARLKLAEKEYADFAKKVRTPTPIK